MARGRRLLARSAAALLGVALLVPALSTAMAAPAHADPGSEEARFIALTNQLRVSRGVNPLLGSRSLVSVARRWSYRMATAGGISHNQNLPNEVSLNWTKLGENVGTGFTVDSIQTAFVNSPHHYENLVDPVYNYLGIGVVDVGSRIYVTVQFMQLDSPGATAAVSAAANRPADVAPGPAPVADAMPVAVAGAETSTWLPTDPSPALILALEQLRAADR